MIKKFILIVGLVVSVGLPFSVCYGAYDIFAGVGARPIALGGAYVGIAEGAPTLYYNPAGVTKIVGREVYLQGGKAFGGILTFTYIGILQKNLGFSHLQQYAELQDKRISQSKMTEYYYNLTCGFELKELLPYLPYKVSHLAELAIGANLKLNGIQSAIDSVTGLGVDLGLLYPIKFERGRLNIGFALKNIAAKLRDERIRGKVSAGIAILLDEPKLNFAADIANIKDYEKKDKSKIGYHVGVEYTPFNLLIFRVGLNNGDFACGASLNQKNFALDYAYCLMPLEERLSNHYLGLTLRF